MPIAREALDVESEIVAQASNALSRLGAFVNHLVGEQFREGIPVSVVGRHPIRPHPVSNGLHHLRLVSAEGAWRFSQLSQLLQVEVRKCPRHPAIPFAPELRTRAWLR